MNRPMNKSTDNPVAIMASYAKQLDMSIGDLTKAYKEDSEVRKEFLSSIIHKRNHLKRAIEAWRKKHESVV